MISLVCKQLLTGQYGYVGQSTCKISFRCCFIFSTMIDVEIFNICMTN